MPNRVECLCDVPHLLVRYSAAMKGTIKKTIIVGEGAHVK